MNKSIVTAIFIALWSSSLFGQALSGTVVGTVTDQTGAAVAEATVIVTNEGTGLARNTNTNAQGQFRADSFPTGSLRISVERPGFVKVVRSGLRLTAADTITVNLELAVGNVTQTVDV